MTVSDRTHRSDAADLGYATKCPPIAVRRTGDDSPAPGIWGYLWRMSGRHQIGACLLAVLVALLDLIPLEIQRRIVDDAIAGEDAALLLTLGLLYGATLIFHKLSKLALTIYQGWIAESAVLYTRGHLLELRGRREGNGDAGEAVSVLNAEVDKLGGFVGDGPSRAVSSLAILVGVLCYMAVVAPEIAGLALLLLLPQAVLAPVLQQRLNRLIERRVNYLRDFGTEIADNSAPEEYLKPIYGNRMRFTIWKALMKAALNLLNGAGPLLVLGIGGALVISGETTLGVVVASLSGFLRLADPVRQLIAFYRQAAQASVQHDMIARWM